MNVAQICNSHGFPHEWTATKYHHIVFREIVKQIEERYDGECIVVDGTWLNTIATHEKLEAMYPNLMRENIDHIFYVDLVDPPVETWGDESKKTVGVLTTARTLHNVPEKSEFQFWAWVAANEYAAYKDIDLPWTGDKLFLSYNRKPYDHRKHLIRTLTDDMLLCKGIVTLGNKDPTKAITVNENVNVPHFNALGNVGVPNDIASLGDHKIWQQAFINVVTETVTTGSFLSEKIWKPIIGKRPFMLVGPPKTLARLRDLGFVTFNNFWDETYDLEDADYTIDFIAETLQKLSEMSHEEQYYMYQQMQSILEYNHKHFFGKFAKSNEHLITRIIRDESV